MTRGDRSLRSLRISGSNFDFYSDVMRHVGDCSHTAGSKGIGV